MRASSLQTLAWLADHPEPGETTISAHLLQHFDDLSALLGEGVTRSQIAGVKDEDLAPALARRLQAHRGRMLEQRRDVARERAMRAAGQLAAEATWEDNAWRLPPSLLWGDLIGDRSAKAISFAMDDLVVAIPRDLMCRAARILNRRSDMSAWIDSGGLHLRWKQGCAGLDFRHQVPACSHEVIVVALPHPPTRPAQTESPLVEAAIDPADRPPMSPPAPPPRAFPRPARPGAWLAAVLADLGWL